MEVAQKKGGIGLQWQMLIGFLVGLIAGLIVYATSAGAEWIDDVTAVTGFIGSLFLRLLFMLVIPLLVSALIVGIAEMGDARQLKRVGLKTLAFTVVVSGIAVVLALLVANVFKPGAGVDRALAAQLLEDAADGAGAIIQRTAETPSGLDAVLAIIPSNVIGAMGANDILAVMFFALFFGIGLLFTDTKPANALQSAIEGVFHVSMKLIMWVIRIAPLAVACFMFNLAAVFGWDILIRLSAYVGVVLLALGTHMFVVYPLVLRIAGGVSPIWFFKNIQEAMVMAFSTARTNLPRASSSPMAESPTVPGQTGATRDP
ncbi:MAG: dicarboxylate/amino acid:cation symporter, partial [Sphingomonadaceae bacterium]